MADPEAPEDEMTREVTAKEKIMALTRKDLTIRVYRSPTVWVIFQLLMLGAAIVLPCIFLSGTEWLWQVRTDFFTRGTKDYGMYDWRSLQAERDYAIGIQVEPEMYDDTVAAFQACHANTYWWGSQWEFIFYDEDDSERCDGSNPEWDYSESCGEAWGTSLLIRDDNGEPGYTQSWILVPFDSTIIWGLWQSELENIAAEATMQQYVSECMSAHFAGRAPSFINYPFDVTIDSTTTTLTSDADAIALGDTLSAQGVSGGYTQYCDLYNDDLCSLWDQVSQQTIFYTYNTIKWDNEAWSRNLVSVMYVMLPGILWGFVVFFATNGFFLHVVQERNSGIKTIMLSMGLSNELYLVAQYLSYLIENSFIMFFVSLFVAIMVSKGSDGLGGNAFYAWFGCVMCFVNMGPFYLGIAPGLHSEKNASSVSSILKWVIPLVPTMIIVQDLNEESAAIRFFASFLPPVNFMFVLRDSINNVITPEPAVMCFLNFFFWWAWAYYIDMVAPSASGQASESCCFCLNRGTQAATHDDKSTELVSRSSSSEKVPLLVVQNLVKEFGTFRAVDHMELEIEENTIYGLLGFNGAGKTTTINMITGILGPTSGQIFIGGKNIATHMNQVRAYIGMCPQHNVLFDLLTVEQHMYLFGALRGMTDKAVDDQMGDLLKAMNMDHQRKTLAESLSGGQKRMLCMIQAFLGDPKLVLLDEPTSGVDAESRRAMWDFIQANKKGKVIILTTHQMREADVLCDKIGIMSAGQLLVEDTPLSLKNKYAVGFTFSAHGADEREVSDLCAKAMPEAEVACDEDEVTIQIPASHADEIPDFVSQLEALESVNASELNVKAATLETVFLQLAKDVEQKGTITKVTSFGGSQVDLSKNIQGDPEAPAPLTRSNTMDRLSHLSTEIGDFHRPCCLTQLMYLLIKRCWLSVIYWQPFITGVAQSCTLAFCVTFILIFFGLNAPAQVVDLNDVQVQYIVNDVNNPGDVYTNRWEAIVGADNLVAYADRFDEMGWKTREDIEDPMLAIDSVNNVIYVEPFHIGLWYSAASFAPSGNTVIDYSAKGQSDITNFLVMPILVLGLGLIISSTWHHIGKEVKQGLYDFQIQSGVHPVLLWFSHWVFDVCINTIMVSIFLGIALQGSGKQNLREYCIYGGLVAFMPYVMIQYILVWGLSNEKAIESMLTWSTFLGIGIFVLELLDVTKMFTETTDLGVFFGKESDMWYKSSKFAFFLCIHYFIPPIQFMHGMFQALFLYYGEDGPTFNEDKKLFYERIWKSLLATLAWSIIFMLMQLYSSNKADPKPKDDQELKLTQEVLDEKALCKDLAQKEDKPLIVANGLSKYFKKNGGPFVAVNDCSFHVNKGECFGLLGKNGAGKSTTMNMMTTLLSQSEGECYLGGYSAKKDKQAIIGYCPQKDLLWEKLTVYQYLLYFGLLKGVPLTQINEEISKLCVGLTLDPYYSRASGNLSGGNKRKLILASALIGSSEVCFLDEPSTGVDPFARKCMMDVIKRYIANRAIILTTHMMEEVEICKRVGIMVNGNFRCVNTIDGLIRDTGSGFQMEVSLSDIKPEQLDPLADYVRNNLPGTLLTQQDSLVMAFQIPKTFQGEASESVAKNHLSRVFQVGQEIKQEFGCEYVVSQMTMDQLFLQLTHDQDAEAMEAGIRGHMEAVPMCCCGWCCCEKGGTCGCL